MRLEELRAIVSATTPGPWGADCENGGRVCDGHCGEPILDSPGYGPASEHAYCQTIAMEMDFHVTNEQACANARFIAAARTEVPTLIDVVEKLRVALAEALDLFDATWCPEHGHAPKPEQLARIAELRKVVLS